MAKTELIEKLTASERRQKEACEAVFVEYASIHSKTCVALWNYKKNRLYREDFASWEEFISSTSYFTKRHADRLIQFYKTSEEVAGLEVEVKSHDSEESTTVKIMHFGEDGYKVGPTGSHSEKPSEVGVVLNERHARELDHCDTPQEKATVLGKALQEAKVSRNGEVKLSASKIRQQIEALNGHEEPDEEEELEAEWDAKAAADHWNSEIESWARGVMKAANLCPEGTWATESTRRDTALTQIKNGLATMRTGKCDVCKKCEGAGCKICRDEGYLPKGLARQLS